MLETHYKVYFTETDPENPETSETEQLANSFFIDKIVVDVVYGAIEGTTGCE